MPITLEYTWEESIDKVIVTIPSIKVLNSNVDLYSNDCLVKVNYPPYLLQIDLKEEVETEKTTAILTDNGLQLTLVKKISELWGEIKFKGTKEEILQRRTDAFQREAERAKQMREKSKRLRIEEERKMFDKQWDIEKQLKKELEERKAAELAETVRDVFSGSSSREDQSAAEDKEREAPLESEKSTVYDDDEYERKVPPPRPTSTIKVAFTQRTLVTPARENKDLDIMDQIEKQRKAFMGTVEENPLWYKEKGDKFVQKGDWESAVEAYTEAIRRDSLLLVAYANRSACYLKMNELLHCISDCDSVLAEIEKRLQRWQYNHSVDFRNYVLYYHQRKSPPNHETKSLSITNTVRLGEDGLEGVDESAMNIRMEGLSELLKLKLKTLARRGAAYGCCDKLELAIADYEAACAIDPDSERSNLLADLTLLKKRLTQL